MNTLAHWIDAPWGHAAGWALVQFAWQGAGIAALAALALFALRRGSARARYAVALSGLLAMPATFAATFAVALSGMHPAAGLAGGAALRGLLERAPKGSGAPGAAAAGDRLEWLVPVWLAGVLLFYGRMLAGWMGVRRLRRTGACCAAPEWQERLRGLAARLRMSRPVMLLESALAEVPMVIGVLRPVVLMPAGLLAGLPPEQVEGILLHELAHIRRFDYLLNVAAGCVEGLLFYHPAVWWLSGVVRAERESCCDDAAVALTGDARGYAAALATCEQLRARPLQGVAASGGNLMKRIQRLLGQPERSCAPATPALSLALLAALVAVALAAPAQTGSQEVAAPVSGPFAKWLREDVAYIITPEERIAFERLQSDQEREHFIEQFWLRRDPTPGTPANEFKTEHYRRIAYANQRFAGGVPGWQTDRGRIYIVLGPPDEIESHPGQNAPYEDWLYHFVQGIGRNVQFRFVDPQGTGDYRLDLNQPNLQSGLLAASQPRDITVAVGPGRVVTLRVPLEGAVPSDIEGRITREGGGAEVVFQQTVRDLPQFSHSVSLPPGSYRVTVTVKDGATGHTRQRDFTIRVQ